MAGNGYEFGRSSTVMAPSWDTLVLFFFLFFFASGSGKETYVCTGPALFVEIHFFVWLPPICFVTLRRSFDVH